MTRPTALATDLPLAFEANQGQFATDAQFVARVPGAVVSLNPEGATFTLSDRPAPLRLRLLGSNPYAQPEILERLPGKVNYFRGSDAGRWRADVPTCARVRYTDVYPGIDIAYYGTAGQLEYATSRPGSGSSVTRPIRVPTFVT